MFHVGGIRTYQPARRDPGKPRVCIELGVKSRRGGFSSGSGEDIVFDDIGGLDLLATICAFLFSFWPLLLVSIVLDGRSLFFAAATTWVLLALMRIFLFFVPSTVFPISFFIPEPANTILFFVAGLLLFGLKVGIRVWKQRRVSRKAGQINTISDLIALSPREFEEMVAQLYCDLGHQAKRTGSMGNHGVDVIVQAQNGEKWIVQCKRWRGSVGEPVIRDFFGVLHHEKADAGAIVTTGQFALQAREWARGKPLHLYDGTEFLDTWKRVQAWKARAKGQISAKQV